MKDGLIWRDLTSSANDLDLLRRFYRDIYVHEFPDRDERESLENMERYLRLKTEGWYGPNNYHILMISEVDKPVAASIIDYLEKPNTGVIEFLVVKPTHRALGLGGLLLTWTEEILQHDAIAVNNRPLDLIIAEMNDPFKSFDKSDSFDPFLRALIWHRWGYRKLRFPYVQPPLSRGKKPVHNLLLLTKAFESAFVKGVPQKTLKCAVHEYLHWAMRFEDPASCREFRKMASFLKKQRVTELIPLASYIGENNKRPLLIDEIRKSSGPDYESALRIYSSRFCSHRTAVPSRVFGRFLSGKKGREFIYHLWGIRISEGHPIRGMVSFFTFPGTGFGGYIVFDNRIRGSGRLASVLARIERQMIIDNRAAHGWFIECAPEDRSAPIFQQKGFWEVEITYRQPPLPGWPSYSWADAPALHLMYKPFGENFERPLMLRGEFLSSLRWIFKIVYEIERPETHDFYRHLESQIGKTIGWR